MEKLFHCLTCKQFTFNCKTLKFECKINNAEPDELVYAFERKICDEWEEKEKSKKTK